MIVFNGEIYNYQELRRLLKSRGYVFNSLTDTECLLHGYREWGIDLPKYCRGMWAWAIWDSKKSELILCRDRLGQKPLYYGWAGKFFIFGSSLAALRQYPDYQREIDRDAVALLLRHSNIPAPYTIYKNSDGKKTFEGEGNQPYKQFNTYHSYKSQLKSYSKKRFDTLCRRNKVIND